MIRRFRKALPIALIMLLTIPASLTVKAGENRVEKLSLEGLAELMKGGDKPHMMIAMAAWCSPCRKELPTLIKLYEKYRAMGLNIVGISLDIDGPKAMQPIVDKYSVNFPVYWVGDEAIKAHNIYAVPMIFMIKNGKVVEKIPGQRSAAYLSAKIEKLLQ